VALEALARDLDGFGQVAKRRDWGSRSSRRLRSSIRELLATGPREMGTVPGPESDLGPLPSCGLILPYGMTTKVAAQAVRAPRLSVTTWVTTKVPGNRYTLAVSGLSSRVPSPKNHS
jgi:hypothetical protein